MKLPPYQLSLPPHEFSPETLAAFEALYAQIESGGQSVLPIGYDLPVPRWQFLCWAADNKPVVLHGSGDENITEFEPRKSNDTMAFGDRCAVYAAGDGIWPMYFAILDRPRYPMTLCNSSFRATDTEGNEAGPLYFFSITREARRAEPWRNGYVYLLPKDGFEQQPPEQHGDWTVHIPQYASLKPVKPLVRLAIAPEDFPFLSQIRGHDDATLFRRIAEEPENFPWVDEEDELKRRVENLTQP